MRPRTLFREHRIAVTGAVVAVTLIVAGVVSFAVTTVSAHAKHVASAESTFTSKPIIDSATGAGAPPRCSGGTTVSTASQLQSALTSAAPGATISLAAGIYRGNFSTAVSGTSGAPISLCGTASSILDGGNLKSGYVLHLDAASHWILNGFTVRDGQKGIVADGTVGTVIENVTVTTIGDEGIHLRDFSTDNTVTNNIVSHTGRHSAKYGEGIYVGTARKNWCAITKCAPDASDRNLIQYNDISQTTAENVDIKEGTTAGILQYNTFHGSGMTAADSWVDVKGNSWIIRGNHGTDSSNDGFQTHQILVGWGTDNRFSSNVSVVNGPGYGIAARPVLANIVSCSNTAIGAGHGVSNIPCTH